MALGSGVWGLVVRAYAPWCERLGLLNVGNESLQLSLQRFGRFVRTLLMPPPIPSPTHPLSLPPSRPPLLQRIPYTHAGLGLRLEAP